MSTQMDGQAHYPKTKAEEAMSDKKPCEDCDDNWALPKCQEGCVNLSFWALEEGHRRYGRNRRSNKGGKV